MKFFFDNASIKTNFNKVKYYRFVVFDDNNYDFIIQAENYSLFRKVFSSI